MPAIEEGYRRNFQALKDACYEGDLAILDAFDTLTNRPVRLVVAMSQGPDDTTDMVPLAVMIDGNPYTRYAPPNLDGSYALDVVQEYRRDHPEECDS